MTHPLNPAPACDMPDGCGAPAGQPCQPGCPSIATDEHADAFGEGTPFVIGATVRMREDIEEPITLGTVVEPTAAERAEHLRAEDMPSVMVAWSPTYRRPEYVEDIVAMDRFLDPID